MIVYAIFLCSGLAGYPQACHLTGYPTFTSLEKCQALAARIQIKMTAGAQGSLTCAKTEIPVRTSA